MRFLASLDKRRWGTALATLALAFLCGYLMQNVLTDQNPDTVAEVSFDAEPKQLPLGPAAVRFSKLIRPPVLTDRVDEVSARDHQQTGCKPSLVVEAAPAATIRIEVVAPCHALARANISQGSVSASAATDDTGRLVLRVPAFTTSPTINVAIAGQKLTAGVDVPDADAFEHVVLQWNGPQALRINAYEFGSQKSQFGHVWSGAPKSPSRASRGSGGFLTKIGDDRGTSVEIYSFPTGQAPTRGVVRLVVEAEVTETNCDQDITATALQSSTLAPLRPTQVDMTLPTCDRVGEIVRLQNLFQDMRLAER